VENRCSCLYRACECNSEKRTGFNANIGETHREQTLRGQILSAFGCGNALGCTPVFAGRLEYYRLAFPYLASEASNILKIPFASWLFVEFAVLFDACNESLLSLSRCVIGFMHIAGWRKSGVIL